MVLSLAQQLAGTCSCNSVAARSSGSSRAGFFQGTPLPSRARSAAPSSRTGLTIEARYRGKGTDLSAVDQFKRHETDSGSAEVQIAKLTARITQMTKHLQEHRKDYAATRGLNAMLSSRRHFLQYVYKHNRSKYDELLKTLQIRPLKIQAGRGVLVKVTEEGAPVEVESIQVTG